MLYAFGWFFKKTTSCLGFCTVCTQEGKYIERLPNTTSAWAGWSRFDISVDRYGRVHSHLICTSSTLGCSTCHQANQQDITYWAKYQKADKASTLCTLWYMYTFIALLPPLTQHLNHTGWAVLCGGGGGWLAVPIDSDCELLGRRQNIVCV